MPHTGGALSARDRRLNRPCEGYVLAVCESWVCVARPSAPAELVGTAAPHATHALTVDGGGLMVRAAAFDAAGRALATGGDDKMIRYWSSLPAEGAPTRSSAP